MDPVFFGRHIHVDMSLQVWLLMSYQAQMPIHDDHALLELCGHDLDAEEVDGNEGIDIPTANVLVVVYICCEDFKNSWLLGWHV